MLIPRTVVFIVQCDDTATTFGICPYTDKDSFILNFGIEVRSLDFFDLYGWLCVDDVYLFINLRVCRGEKNRILGRVRYSQF